MKAFAQQDLRRHAFNQTRQTVPHTVDLEDGLAITQTANQKVDDANLTQNTLAQIVPRCLLCVPLQVEIGIDLNTSQSHNVPERAHYCQDV